MLTPKTSRMLSINWDKCSTSQRYSLFFVLFMCVLCKVIQVSLYEHFLSQGYYSRLALRETGPFLRYMESEFNIKVCVGWMQEWVFLQIANQPVAEVESKTPAGLSSTSGALLLYYKQSVISQGCSLIDCKCVLLYFCFPLNVIKVLMEGQLASPCVVDQDCHYHRKLWDVLS